ncbi:MULTISPECIES: fatty acid desaturase [Prochlorococcus]|uniref:Fatty acid desaturase n=1 Tax=Prochlorococcus marinus (strain SARG / CCMP1375 / SS120) TaxID=167539 RepID=Q7VB90_PROMA|nr:MULTISPECIES: fatty acid desaturase [Prochlorococcus]AAQ00253.1 Fatty acid desaturase [Prochlorococcus marinus subsp. marinus str. CCMP1375]KGG14056.1 Fatty acid desaturase [Prochlorococcus marinus str. LG]KGG19189.1 Fatty acid desaturase [Prochlorococcus marinus str. SS2]KGG25176.1 Fatty acid desaturase [Prochlorococcus marinus str. SS35]KGG32494.1 Fatty acid desaturase [Prochlorococcus marinus str. SS51]
MRNHQTIQRSDFVITPYLKRSNARAFWQVSTTIIPVALLWILIAWIDQSSFKTPFRALGLIPVLAILTLLSSRAFSLMHDCGHGSLFRSRRLNRITGFLLGTLNAIPQYPWSRDHAFHHRHNGNWEVYRGPVDVITLEDYQALSKINQFLYSISRHWLMLFPGGFFYLVIKPRLTLINAIAHFIWSILVELCNKLLKRDFANLFSFSTRFQANYSGYGNSSGELIDLIANNVIVIISWILMSRWLGAGLFWSCYSIIMTASAAIFICIFFVQHNFEGSYANGSNEWSAILGAVDGSSNLDIPRLLNWFLADISFHSMHHLCDRIPNYNLRACHIRNKHLLVNAKYLKISDIPGCFEYILWDEHAQQLATI